MESRARTSQILENKKRNPRRPEFISYDLGRLEEKWLNSDQKQSDLSDFLLIRCVTYLEVFTRGQVAGLVDHGKHYTDRAVELSKHFKMDFATVQEIQGRVITLGDIIAHNIPVNSFSQIISHFETLLNAKLRTPLSEAIDRWETEINKKPPAPIVTDYDRMAKCLARMFEVRHILCHEMTPKPVYDASEVGPLLKEVGCFTRALEQVLTYEKYGLVPLTQTEMNIDAHEKLKIEQQELDSLCLSIRTRVRNADQELDGYRHPAVPQTWLQSFEDAQGKWLAYRNAQCDFEVYLNQGGTIMPTLWAGKATQLTKSRIEELKAWIEEENNT